MRKLILLILLSSMLCNCDKKENPLLGQIAYDFSLINNYDQQQKLSDFKDKNIMLHFWADWCASCREEFYTLQNVYDSVKDKDATVIGINVGQTKEHVQELIDEYAVTFTMLRDEDKSIAEKYHVVGLPMNYFITKSGQIHKVVTGWMDKEKILEVFKQMENLK